MAVVARGWSRTASTAVKLATAERIIGYQFKDVDRLYEALDQYEHRSLLPSGKVHKERRRNTRLALVGDAQARLHLAQKWYDQSDLAGTDWSKIHHATLSNESLSQIGFKLGLDECASKLLQRRVLPRGRCQASMSLDKTFFIIIITSPNKMGMIY